ncbi:MAG: glutamine synthetase III [Oscillospiraceae bacterium]|nr:glutamine synthetase III [Oscillospiraceae bacterium]
MNTELEKNFGCRVFNDDVMRERLPENAYNSLVSTIKKGLPLNIELAETVAGAMKDWAVEQGATHFTHWFQPMNNATAGKFDAFLTPTADGKPMLEFSGKELVKGEPDASSFPSGGLRVTFEARGYTVWDPNSPAFVKDNSLYIPTAFCSYTGEALDHKTPLVRSNAAVSEQALRVLRCLGDTETTRVITTVGAEQEYFLVDREDYENRLDLKICGRTLFGSKTVKGQELGDHYCGRIRLRVSEFMKKLDSELWKMGVASKTKHNEAAPAQHELAPLYCESDNACDHNQIVMETMRIEAKKLGLACLLHEKPFDGVNGSGKHNNWSLSTDLGENLFSSGKHPEHNLKFLTFLCAVIIAVDKYQDLIRFSAASAGNDCRLGGHEAPPSIISVFLGDALTDILNHIANHTEQSELHTKKLLDDIAVLPTLNSDSSDRNRTSPFAFTGNKFEFRMVGSSASVAVSTYIMNTICAEALEFIADRLKNATSVEEGVVDLVSYTVKNHGRIIFNGNNYSEAWHNEAERRGLCIMRSTVDAAKALADPKNIILFEKYRVLNKTECLSRYEICLENYVKTINIEADTMLEMASRQILPACVKYAGDVANSALNLSRAGAPSSAVDRLVKELSTRIDEITNSVIVLSKMVNKLSDVTDWLKKAELCRDEIIPAMNNLRKACDSIEPMVDKKCWPMPTYTEILHRI